MRFIRGQDPKESMGIGLEALKVSAVRYLSQNTFDRFFNEMHTKQGIKLLKKDFLEVVGVPLTTRRLNTKFYFYLKGEKRNILLPVDWTIQKLDET